MSRCVSHKTTSGMEDLGSPLAARSVRRKTNDGFVVIRADAAACAVHVVLGVGRADGHKPTRRCAGVLSLLWRQEGDDGGDAQFGQLVA